MSQELPTEAQRKLLKHTLGLNRSNGTPYRNHFVSGAGDADLPDLESLVEQGLMYRRVNLPAFSNPDDIVFHVTDAGYAHLGVTRP